MIFYAIKHSPTGKYLPNSLGKKGRGGTHVEPMCFPHCPRLFSRRQDASTSLTWWLRGKVTVHITSGGSYDCGEYDEDWRVKEMANRKKEEFEIVKIYLKEII